MKYFFYILFVIQLQNCKSESESISPISSNKEIKADSIFQDNYLINSINKMDIGKKIDEENKTKHLKTILKNSYEREVVRPYMWDIFVSNNDSLLQFFDYKFFLINDVKFKSYYIKIDYEDGNYESIMLVNESANTEYNSMIIYENVESEEKHLRITQVKGDKIEINFKSPNHYENLNFQVKNGLFLDFFDNQIINKKWGDKKILSGNEFFEYQLQGKTINHLKNGPWVEVRYSFEYNKVIIENGNYINGLRNGKWYFSPEGPADMIKIFDKGKFISKSYL